MKRYYPLLVAIILSGGVAWYVMSGKAVTTSTAATMPTSNTEDTFMGSTPTPVVMASKLSDGTHTSKSVPTDYGDIQVALVVSGGKITTVNVLKQPGSESRSIQINADAIPKLKAEVLAAQSSKVNAISGASFTSAGFMTALDSAFAS
ncbi:MAG: FMN-binding protein [Candidatus Saccharibacteria bacterium]